MKHKINFHAHSKFSDGNDSIYDIAAHYKRSEFCCAIVTDHYYGIDPDTGKVAYPYATMATKDIYLKACEEAEDASRLLDFPVIVGMEYGFFRSEEVLCFGRDFICALYEHPKDVAEFAKLREKHPSACILCHPGLSAKNTGFLAIGGDKVIDGYEHFNSGANMFQQSWRNVPDEFKALTAFSNSDAHSLESFDRGYNWVDEEIKNEEQLINYIREKRPVEMFTHFEEER